MNRRLPAVLVSVAILSGWMGIIVRADAGAVSVPPQRLWEPAQDSATRLQAARTLLQSSDAELISEAQAKLRGALRQGGTEVDQDAQNQDAAPDTPRNGVSGNGMWSAFLQAVAQSDAPPRWVTGLLDEMLGRAGEGLVVEALPAVARYPDRALVARLIELLEGDGFSAATQQAICRALERMTGLSGGLPSGNGGRDAAWWRGWWADRHTMPAADWNAMIALHHARLNEQLQRERAQTNDRVFSLYRQLYGLLPEAERDTMLADLIRSRDGVWRDLGLDLARRALLSARALGPGTIEAMSALMDSRTDTVRLQAAELLDRADPRGFSSRAGTLLMSERSPQVAAAMLRGVARSPREGMDRILAEWVTSQTEATSPAIEASLATIEAGMWRDQGALDDVVSVVLGRIPERIQPPGVRLLAVTGRMDELRILLQSERAGVAEATAQALVDDSESLEAILDAARERPSLFAATSAALVHHDRSARALERLLSLPSTTDAEREQGVRALVDALPGEELLKAVRFARDDAERAQWLSRAATAEFVDASEQETVVRALTLLARARLALDDVDGAQRALEMMPGGFDGVTAGAEWFETKLRRGEVAEAFRIADESGMHASACLRAVERLRDAEQTLQAISLLRERFGDELSLAEEARVNALEMAAREWIEAQRQPEEVDQESEETTDAPTERNADTGSPD